MTQENKELLLKDLCARLPYYPKCEMIDELRVVNNEKDSSYISTLFPKHIELFSYHNNFTIKPYLRPMSSMTEEEKEEFHKLKQFSVTVVMPNGVSLLKPTYIVDLEDDGDGLNHLYDWLNAYHFDYRGLIEKRLAIAVTPENNPYNV